MATRQCDLIKHAWQVCAAWLHYKIASCHNNSHGVALCQVLWQRINIAVRCIANLGQGLTQPADPGRDACGNVGTMVGGTEHHNSLQ